MSTAVATITAADDAQVDLIRKTICPTLTNDEFALFRAIAKAKELSILQRQIYAVKRWSAAQQCEVMTIQTSIDGYRLIAQRHGLAGIDDGIPKGSVKIDGTKDRYAPESVTITVYRRDPKTGERDPYTATATWQAYYPDDPKKRFMWQKRPREQLEKCAEALALRRGFQEVAGLYTTDEMQQADGDKPPSSPRQSQQTAPTVIEGAVVNGESIRRPDDATDAQIGQIKILREEHGIGWDALCTAVLSRTIEGRRATYDEGTQLIAWLKQRERQGDDPPPLMDDPR